MAQITFDIPAGVTNRVLDALAARHGYNASVDGTKAAFAKKVIKRWIMDEVRAYEGSAAGAVAQLAAAQAVDTDIVIT